MRITTAFIIFVVAVTALYFLQDLSVEWGGFSNLFQASLKAPLSSEKESSPGQEDQVPYSSPEKKSSSAYQYQDQRTRANYEKTPSQEYNYEPEEEKPAQKSPYYQKVRISRPSAASSYRPSMITLRSRLYQGEKVKITGWRIRTRKGEIEIGKGMEKYRSYLSPKNIYIERGDTIYVINEKNPLGRGRNFKVNKCFGYIRNYHDFYPSLYSSCPRTRLEDLPEDLTPSCKEYILRLSNCEIPDYSNNLKIATDSSCVDYLNSHFNYSSCYKNHYQDDDFLKNRWYIYAPGRDIVEPLHDTIYLLDQNDLIVDEYTY